MTLSEPPVQAPGAGTSAGPQDITLWYHTLELPDGVVTPGWFDLRQNTGRLPWPEVAGKRCLDVATYDGFYAFELERRGAAEVVAIDIPSHEEWDWPPTMRARGANALGVLAGEKGHGFEVARRALSSGVQKRTMNVYDLRPEAVGRFDVVVCGSLLLHLRDPVRALEAIRSVCDGAFLSIEAVSLPLTVLQRRRPAAQLSTEDRECQWWKVNVAGHSRLVEMAGFDVLGTVGPFSEAFGAGHPARTWSRRSSRELAARVGRRLLTGGEGIPHAALLAVPRDLAEGA